MADSNFAFIAGRGCLSEWISVSVTLCSWAINFIEPVWRFYYHSIIFSKIKELDFVLLCVPPLFFFFFFLISDAVLLFIVCEEL